MDDLATIIVAGFILGIIVLGVLFGANAVSRATCNQQWEQSKFEHQYGFIKGCLIKVNGQWLPADNYREIN